MRTITTTTGASITLDGDLLAIMETLYREVTARRELNRSFEDMTNEITHLIDQMDEAERQEWEVLQAEARAEAHGQMADDPLFNKPQT
jgi:sensor histidine kinase YesM